MSVKWDLSKLVDKRYSSLSPKDILKLPVSVIRGISEKDEELLNKAFGIKTVGDLANNKYIAIAQAIVTLAPFWEKALDKEWEKKSPVELVSAPIDALSGVTPEDAELLRKALGIKTIQDLAMNRLILFALALKALAYLQDLLEEANKEFKE